MKNYGTEEKVTGKDGYYSIFTTCGANKKFKDYKQNGNASWAKNPYWDSTMAKSGCGIAAMATILSGYGKNYTPEDLRQRYYPVLNYNERLSKELNDFGIKNTDFYFENEDFSEEKLKEHLKTNRPVLICVWAELGVNRWTTASHYLVLLATDGKDMVYVANPNGGINDTKSSGWYSFSEVVPYIAKAMYIES